MLQWVDDVLKPYVETAPSDIVPLLFLDSYKCHLMSSVISKIQDLGVEFQHIPGGCTGLTQPVDVGINKPLKNRI
jgi:DDE superfamily endonuclease